MTSTGAETAEQAEARRQARIAMRATHAANRDKVAAARAELFGPLEAEVAKARARLLAFDRSAKRQQLVDAFRAARERLADARYPMPRRPRPKSRPMPRSTTR